MWHKAIRFTTKEIKNGMGVKKMENEKSQGW